MIKLVMLACAAMPLAYMFETCETVLIKGADGHPVRVNKSSYDDDQAGPKKMHLHTDDKLDQPAPMVGTPLVTPAPGLVIPPAPSAPNFADPVAPQTANADTILVTGKGRKFIAVYADGTPVTDKLDIDEKGYDTAELAWAAVMRVKRQPFEQSATPPANMPTADQIADAAKNPQA